MFRGNSLWRRLSIARTLLLITLAPTIFFAQTKKPDEQKQGMGVSTGEARSYASRRTVGVTEPKAPVVFEDVTARTALGSFRNRSGAPEKNYIVETASAGVAIFDYDGDGRPDIYYSTARPSMRRGARGERLAPLSITTSATGALKM